MIKSTYLFNKSRRANVCSTLFINRFLRFCPKTSSSCCADCRTFFNAEVVSCVFVYLLHLLKYTTESIHGYTDVRAGLTRFERALTAEHKTSKTVAQEVVKIKVTEVMECHTQLRTRLGRPLVEVHIYTESCSDYRNRSYWLTGGWDVVQLTLINGSCRFTLRCGPRSECRNSNTSSECRNSHSAIHRISMYEI